VAAHLQRAGNDVFFCVRRQPGQVHVDGIGPVEIPAFQANPPPAEIVLVTVKAQDTASVRTWLEAMRARRPLIAVIQNGVQPERRLAPHPAMPVLAYVYVEESLGVLRAFAPPREEFTVPDCEGGRQLRGLFHASGLGVQCEPAFAEAAWRKMLHNCVSNPLTALAGRGLEILREPLYRSWALGVLREALPIARREGVELHDEVIEETLAVLQSYPPGTRTSMLQDRERGRPLELDALTGALVAAGRSHGLPVPVNEDLLRRLQN
jgi:2-dehydropantoate 2-reductase